MRVALMMILSIFCLINSTNCVWRRRRRCHVIHCSVGIWSPWTTCSSACGPHGVSRRTRAISQGPACGGSGCPITQESRPCNRECGHGILENNACKCNTGWHGHCCHLDVNECIEAGRCQQICRNTIGSFECLCKPGYNLLGSSQCQDIDECSMNWCDQKCQNTIGSVNCICDVPGYKLSNDLRSCDVDNECLVAHNCDQICIKKKMGYDCKCRSGFYTEEGGTKCQDVDECLQGHHDCAQQCINLPGKYECKCKAGFITYDEGRTCTDIDECKLESTNCGFFCKNYKGGYTCACPPGLMLNSDGRTCSDVDECSSSIQNCSVCNNIYGSYYCSCLKGFFMTKNDTCEEIIQHVQLIDDDDNSVIYIAILSVVCCLVLIAVAGGLIYKFRRRLPILKRGKIEK